MALLVNPMVQKIALVAATLLLSGCITTKEVAMPDGTQAISISCNGTARDMADCMNKAAEVCEGPYTVLNSSEKNSGTYAQGNMHGTQNSASGSVVAVPVIKRSLLISCDAS